MGNAAGAGQGAAVGQPDGNGSGRIRRTLRRMRMAGLGFQVCLPEASAMIDTQKSWLHWKESFMPFNYCPATRSQAYCNMFSDVSNL